MSPTFPNEERERAVTSGLYARQHIAGAKGCLCPSDFVRMLLAAQDVCKGHVLSLAMRTV
jgi:hypothetical protein